MTLRQDTLAVEIKLCQTLPGLGKLLNLRFFFFFFLSFCPFLGAPAAYGGSSCQPTPEPQQLTYTKADGNAGSLTH